MDVAKHISLFLLKNKYCQLQGLGNLEIRRIPATSSGTHLSGGFQQVNWNAAGAVDDQLPLFIALQEGISSSEASTALDAFIAAATVQLESGKAVALPGIGAFVLHQGQIRFHTDESFILPEGSIPLSYFHQASTLDNHAAETPASEKTDEIAAAYEQYNHAGTAASTPWLRIGLWALGILLILSVAAGILRYSVWDRELPPSQPLSVNSADIQIDSSSIASTHDSATVSSNDSLGATDSTLHTATSTGNFRFILNKYKRLGAAEKRVKKLISCGHPVKVISIHDSLHYVVEELQIPASDTTRIKDSLTRWLSPGGVDIMQ